MPRGTPRNGFRLTARRQALIEAHGGDHRKAMKDPTWHSAVAAERVAERDSGQEDHARLFRIQHEDEKIVPAKLETEQEIEARQTKRFEILEELVQATTGGSVRALIVAGPPGLGKSYTVEEQLSEYDPTMNDYTIVKGFVRATNLFKLLFQHKEEGQIICFDDADAVFFDDVSLNLLKAVCDSTDKRTVSWLTDRVPQVDEKTGVQIPKTFEFNGSIIFITNLDFDKMIARGEKLAPHLGALISRAHYVDLAMKTKRDYLVRIKSMIKRGMLRQRGLTAEQEKDVLDFIVEHADRLRELSLRIALKVATIRTTGKPNRWKDIAEITCCRNA